MVYFGYESSRVSDDGYKEEVWYRAVICHAKADSFEPGQVDEWYGRKGDVLQSVLLASCPLYTSTVHCPTHHRELTWLTLLARYPG